MIDLRRQCYVPVVRTRDAEMKGFERLRKSALDRVLPLIEITKSRRSKTNPSGKISKSIGRTLDLLEERPFIVDLCSSSAHQNVEIDDLLDQSNSFRKWTNFVRDELPANCIPVAHLTDPHVARDFSTQFRNLSSKSGWVALRVPTSYSDMSELAGSVKELSRADGTQVILLADAGYVRPTESHAAFLSCKRVVEAFGASFKVAAPLSSSFPSSVVDKGYGADDTGQFDLSEVYISKQLKREFRRTNVWHGDYSSIHPLDFDGIVTNWVPRVDVPLDDTLYYYRYRRGDGGYVRAADEALSDKRYVSLTCWGDKNVQDAASGSPQGKSPAHWIAVRLNFHISRQVARLS